MEIAVVLLLKNGKAEYVCSTKDPIAVSSVARAALFHELLRKHERCAPEGLLGDVSASSTHDKPFKKRKAD